MTRKLDFLNRTSQAKKSINTAFSEKAKGNLLFVVGLGPLDSIKILDQ